MLSPSQVFISVKTEDNAVAAKLNKALTALGYDVWWQGEDLKSGQDWHGEINQAIPAAGAVVVLWSEKSMASSWVRHEASQGIAKGTYTPVRIEAIEIPRPYDRVQAIDLMNWDGTANHAGFQNLLVRLKTQMPPPVPLWRQATTLLWKQRAVIMLAAIALAALYLLVHQGSLLSSQSTTLNSQVGILKTQVGKQEDLFKNAQLQNQSLASQGQKLESQLRKQEEIINNGKAQSRALKAQLRQQGIITTNVESQRRIMQNQIVQQVKILADVQRALQPIQNLNITASVEVGSTTPGLNKYLLSLRKDLFKNGLITNNLPPGILFLPEDKPGVLTIQENSGFWPPKQEDDFLFYVVRYVDLALKFNGKGNAGGKPDLLMYVSSYDRDKSERGADEYSSTLKWNLNDNTLRIDFTDVPATRMWETANGNIVSVPDLEGSYLSAGFLNRPVFGAASPAAKGSPNAVAASRAQLALVSLCVDYSGRKACFRGPEMKKSTDKEGLLIYSAPVSQRSMK